MKPRIKARRGYRGTLVKVETGVLVGPYYKFFTTDYWYPLDFTCLRALQSFLGGCVGYGPQWDTYDN